MRRLRPLLLLAASVGFVPDARAAIAPWPMGGCLAADPAGIDRLPVTRQRLTVDLGPAVDGGPARVTALYELDLAAAAAAPIWVKASAQAGEPRVTLDGRPVALRPGTPDARPTWWDWPPGAPDRSSTGTAFFAADLDLAPGRHSLEVRYPVELYSRHAGEPTLIWEFEYFFAPAAGRPAGEVEVAVHLPPGWVDRSRVPLARAGDTLTGRYDAPPAELSVAAQLSVPESSGVGLMGYGLALAGGGLACGLIGFALGRAGAARAWLWGLLFGIVYGGAVFGVALLGLSDRLNVPEVQQDRNHDQFRLDLIGAVLAAVVSVGLVPLGCGLTVLGAALGRATGPSGGRTDG